MEKQAEMFNMIHNISMSDFGRMYLRIKMMEEGLATSFDLYVDKQQILDDDTFWDILEEMKKELLGTIRGNVDRNIRKANIKLGLSRFAWEYAHGKKSDKLDDLVRFVKTYHGKCADLYKPLFDVIKDYSDDGYGDMLDAFPLFGRERYAMALKGEIVGSSDDQYQGENYIKMFLQEKVFEKFGQIARSIACDFDAENGVDLYRTEKNKAYKELGLKCDD